MVVVSAVFSGFDSSPPFGLSVLSFHEFTRELDFDIDYFYLEFLLLLPFF